MRSAKSRASTCKKTRLDNSSYNTFFFEVSELLNE